MDYWEITSLYEKIMERVLRDDNDCWLYMCALQHGYGEIAHKGRMYRTHRITYTYTYGEIPDGLVIDHLCKVKNCVNPNHLEAVTQAENTNREEPHHRPNLFNYSKTHCSKGHEFSPENTKVYLSGGYSKRKCLTCHKMAGDAIPRKTDRRVRRAPNIAKGV